MNGRIQRLNSAGFSMVELLIACIIFPLIMVGISGVFDTVQRQYTLARQMNEMYAVLSACPEIDRALDYASLNSTVNCFPNNIFQSEGGTGDTVVYTPTLTVTPTASLPTTDPLRNVPDSKVVSINVGYPNGSTAPPLYMRMLITRNGIGQQ